MSERKNNLNWHKMAEERIKAKRDESKMAESLVFKTHYGQHMDSV